ncbi:MAG: putative collagen-binding domain-containing protein, partial [Devosia sp.]
ALIDKAGIGIEMIMEAWGFEFPFNHRMVFTPEWEALWMRYLIARYDAYNSTYFWTPLNEYEYYPNGDWNWKPAADRWQMRIGHYIKDTSAHGHIIACHNGPRIPPFAQRFRADPDIVESIMYQEWGTREKDNGWLAAGIEDVIGKAFAGWTGSRIFAEWGYERNPNFENKLPHHEFCDRNHTRRSAWRGVTQAMGIINGQENSWGPWMLLEEDLPGTADLVVLKNFLLKDVPFHTLEAAPDLVKGSFEFGHKPLALRGKAGEVAVVYYPAGGGAAIDFTAKSARWFDPRTGKYQPATATNGTYAAPAGKDENKRPLDYVLVLSA